MKGMGEMIKPVIRRQNLCAVPKCKVDLLPGNKSGVCRHHLHKETYCQCRRCCGKYKVIVRRARNGRLNLAKYHPNLSLELPPPLEEEPEKPPFDAFAPLTAENMARRRQASSERLNMARDMGEIAG